MIVFDLDGTLADCEHRRHLVNGTVRDAAPNWAEFFARCVDDTPIWPVIHVLEHMYNGGEVLEIWSSRDYSVYLQTLEWLNRYLGAKSRRIPLRMRPAGNTEPDTVIKERWLDEVLRQGLTVEMVFDDRAKVVEMWRRRGILCAQVALGAY